MEFDSRKSCASSTTSTVQSPCMDFRFEDESDEFSLLQACPNVFDNVIPPMKIEDDFLSCLYSTENINDQDVLLQDLKRDEINMLKIGENRKRKKLAFPCTLQEEKYNLEKQLRLVCDKLQREENGICVERKNRLVERRAILRKVWEAWNVGGFDELEEIAEEVYHRDATLHSPDHTDELKGIKAILVHWQKLFDAFPDGMMEKFIVEQECPDDEKMRVLWTFSGTQVCPFFDVPPRREKVVIHGKSFVSFKEGKIFNIVLTWNYREALKLLMGIPSTESLVNHVLKKTKT